MNSNYHPQQQGSMADEWVPCQNSEGRVYWYNKGTGQVTWERPPQHAQQPNNYNQQPMTFNNQTQQQYPQHYSQNDPRMHPPQQQQQGYGSYGGHNENQNYGGGMPQHGGQGGRGGYDQQQHYNRGSHNAMNEDYKRKHDGDVQHQRRAPPDPTREQGGQGGPPGFDSSQRRPPGFSENNRGYHPQENRGGYKNPQYNNQRQGGRYNNDRRQPPRQPNKRRGKPRQDNRGAKEEPAQVNWGAVRQLQDGQWQTRTPEGQVLNQLFKTREEATEFLRNRKRQQQEKIGRNVSGGHGMNNNQPKNQQRGGRKPQHIEPQQNQNNENKNNRARVPSPPAYIAPMPADLWDDEDEEEEEDVHQDQRPQGREITTNSSQEVNKLALTSSVELRSIYQNGFEEWKPSKCWDHEDDVTRVNVAASFRKEKRTAVITATGVIYTEFVETNAITRVTVDDIIFTKTVRKPDRPKFLIRLQHAVEHQLAVALYRANFTRMSGETTPMYVFMAQSSGQEIRLPNGKTITNFSGVVPHVKIRNETEIHLEMVPAEKSFLTKTVRDMINRGKPKTFFKDSRGLVRTSSKLVTVTIVQISDQKSMEATDPTTNRTVSEMSKMRGAAFSYGDAVVVETSHGLFSSDEIYPSARLNKKEQAARDKQLKKHRYVDRQQSHFETVKQFKEELFESISRHHIGLELSKQLILAPCTYLPEVQVKRSGGHEGESIGSKSRHHEWDRLLKKPPAKLKLSNMVVLVDTRFREMNSLQKIFRALCSRRNWIPDPKFVSCNLADLVKVWDSRPQNVIRITSEDNLDKAALETYFNKIGQVSTVKVSNKYASVQFRQAGCVPGIIAQSEHLVNGQKIICEPFMRLNQHQKKAYMPVFNGIRNTDGVIVLLPGREGSPQATHVKNRLTMMINGEDGLNPAALQFIMASNIRHNSKRSLPILQEALESGLVPKTGAVTFQIDQKRCEFDLVMAVDVSMDPNNRIATIVATNEPYEGSLSSMKALVTKVDGSKKTQDVINYDQMTAILQKLGVKGRNILLYRHNACVDSRDIFCHEIQACVDYFQGCHVTLVEVTSRTSLRVLDVEYPPIKGKQAKSEFIITQKVTRTCKKCIEYYIRHMSKSNPVRYSIIFSTNREILNVDEEILNVAIFTHHLTKNYVHHKDGSKLPGPLKYADHIARFYTSILKTMGRDRLPKFHPKALRPIVL